LLDAMMQSGSGTLVLLVVASWDASDVAAMIGEVKRGNGVLKVSADEGGAANIASDLSRNECVCSSSRQNDAD
jgi:hypothetical protein